MRELFSILVLTVWKWRWVIKMTVDKITNYQNKMTTNSAINTIKDFILKGGNVNQLFKYGNSFLMAAARYKDAECAFFLLKNGADANIIDSMGNTALHYAVEFGARDVVEKLLLFPQLKINHRNIHKVSPLDLACRFGNLDIFNLLIAQGRLIHSESAFQVALEYRHVEILKTFLNLGKSFDDPRLIFNSDLNIEIAKLYIDYGMDLENPNQFGETLLSHTCYHEAIQLTSLLLINGVNVNQQDYHGNTPLHIVAISGNRELAALLLEYGADVSIKNEHGQLPHHHAKMFYPAGQSVFDNI